MVFIERVCGGKNPKARFVCDCGDVCIKGLGNVKAGRTVSCGCRLRETWEEQRTHSMTNSLTHNTWENMLNRCSKTSAQGRSNPEYARLGVCEKWKVFENFYEDMGAKPKGTTLDRIEGSMGYFKENCRWATKKLQQQNIKSNVWLTYNGKTQTQSDWARELGIAVTTLAGRRVRMKGDDSRIFHIGPMSRLKIENRK